MKNASLPIALIAVGVAWLLWHFRLFPDIDWLIAAALMAAGVAILLIDRVHPDLDRHRSVPHRHRHRVDAARPLARDLVRPAAFAAGASRRADAHRADVEPPRVEARQR